MAGVKGRSGRRPKTVQQHHADGTYNVTRHTGIENPEPPIGRPPVPDGLTGAALAEWVRMLDRLSESRTLSVVDDAVVYQYCRLWAETEALATTQGGIAGAIARVDKALESGTDEVCVALTDELTKLWQLQSRYTTQIRQGRLGLRAYLVEFGLTPASRGRVRVLGHTHEQTTSPLARLQQQAHGLRRVS